MLLNLYVYIIVFKYLIYNMLNIVFIVRRKKLVLRITIVTTNANLITFLVYKCIFL
ncbi:hypothetical protein ZORO111902_20130 [Zobellia roscoffensis]